MSSAAQRAMFIPHIQEYIFSLSGKDDVARCATVCKDWSDLALNYVWAEVDNHIALYKILDSNLVAHLYNSGKVADRFFLGTTPQVIDRERLAFYATRIKVLTINSKKHGLPSEELFREFLFSRIGSIVLPNLKRLNIRFRDLPALYSALPFLHAQLQTLDIDGRYPSEGKVDFFVNFLREVSLRSPRLRDLYIGLSINDLDIFVGGLYQLLTSQECLHNIVLPGCILLSAEWGLLCRMPKLQEFFCSSESMYGVSCASHDGDGVGCFPALTSLGLAELPRKAASFLSVHPNLTRLKKFKLVSPERSFDASSESEFERFIVAVSACTELEVLELTFPHNGGGRQSIITLQRLAKFKPLRKLRRVTFSTSEPFEATENEIVDFLSGFPALEVFALHVDQSTVSSELTDVPSLQVLHRIAQCQPDLRQLSLCCKALALDNNHAILDIPITPFKELEVLDVGCSEAGNESRTALYLSRLLPSGCEIKQCRKGESVRSWESVKKLIAALASMVSMLEWKEKECQEKERELAMLREELDVRGSSIEKHETLSNSFY